MLQETVLDALNPHPSEGPNAYVLADYFKTEWQSRVGKVEYKRFTAIIRAYLKLQKADAAEANERTSTGHPGPVPLDSRGESNSSGNQHRDMRQPQLPRTNKGKGRMLDVAAPLRTETTNSIQSPHIFPPVKPPKPIVQAPPVPRGLPAVGPQLQATSPLGPADTRLPVGDNTKNNEGIAHKSATVHAQNGPESVPQPSGSGAPNRAPAKRRSRKASKTPAVVSADEDSREHVPPPLTNDKNKKAQEKTKSNVPELADYVKQVDPCTSCIQAGIECWRLDSTKEGSGRSMECRFCENGNRRCRVRTEESAAGSSMGLSTELGDLTKYLETDKSTNFPAPGTAVEDGAAPETVGELLVALLATVRAVKDEQHSVRADIREVKLLVEAESIKRAHDIERFDHAVQQMPGMAIGEQLRVQGEVQCEALLNRVIKEARDVTGGIKLQVEKTTEGMQRMENVVTDLNNQMQYLSGEMISWKVNITVIF